MATPPVAAPDGTDVTALEDLATHIAIAAGRLVVDERPRLVEASATKSSPTDIVTVMDTRAEELIRELLHDERPDDAVLGEEGDDLSGTSGITWVVDPIDGTVNYLYDIPAYAVSVAAAVGDPKVPGEWRVLAGAVADPAQRRVYHAAAGCGAYERGVGGAPPVRRPGAAAGRLRGRPVSARWSVPASATRRSAGWPRRRRCWRCCRGSATSAGSAAPPSTSARSPAAGWTGSTSPGSTRGTWRPAG